MSPKTTLSCFQLCQKPGLFPSFHLFWDLDLQRLPGLFQASFPFLPMVGPGCNCSSCRRALKTSPRRWLHVTGTQFTDFTAAQHWHLSISKPVLIGHLCDNNCKILIPYSRSYRLSLRASPKCPSETANLQEKLNPRQTPFNFIHLP
jgi:hypothetical protein